jgi:hypothetical protein
MTLIAAKICSQGFFLYTITKKGNTGIQNRFLGERMG